MKYKKLLFFTLLAFVNFHALHAMEETKMLSHEDAQEIANKINRVRNDLIETWKTDMSDPSNDLPCSPFQTTARHILLLHENNVVDVYKLNAQRSKQINWIDREIEKIEEQRAANNQ